MTIIRSCTTGVKASGINSDTVNFLKVPGRARKGTTLLRRAKQRNFTIRMKTIPKREKFCLTIHSKIVPSGEICNLQGLLGGE